MLGFDAATGPRVQRRYSRRWPTAVFTALEQLPPEPGPLLMPPWAAVILHCLSPAFATFPPLVSQLRERMPRLPIAVVAPRADRDRLARDPSRAPWPVIEQERLTGLTARLADPDEPRPRVDHRRERAEKLRLQDQLTKLAASVPGVIYTFRLGADGSVTFPYASPTLAAIFGVTFHALEQDGSPVFAVIHPEDRPVVQDTIAASAAALTPWYGEFRIQHPTRGERWMEGRSLPQREPDGGTTWHGFVADVTERRQREAQLAASERDNRAKQALLRGLLDSIPDLVFFKDRQSRYLGCNKAFEADAGMSERELIGKNDLELAAPDIAEGYRAMDREILAGGQSRRVEEWIPFKQGGGGHFETLKTPFRGPDGGILGLIGISRDITERTQAQRALEESRARYRFLFDGMMEGCAYCRMIEEPGQPPDYVHLNVNASFERLTGLRDARGRRVTELIPDLRATNPELFDIYGRVARTGVPEHFEDYVPSLQQWFAISVSSPERGYFVTVFEVITARKQAERALRQSEQRYRTTLDSMLEGCQNLDADGYFLYVNDSAALHARKPKEELIGRQITRVYPGFDQTSIYVEIQKCLSLGIARQLQNEFVYPDGERRWFDLSLHPVPEGLFILSIDITARRQAEEVLRQSEERFRQLFDRVTKLAVQGYGPDGTVRMWNKASETLYGYTAEEAIGRNLVDLIIPLEQREKVRAEIQQMVATGVEHRAEELRLLRKDGSLVPVYSNHTIVDVHGRGKELYCIDIDLTELKRAEAELQHSQERLTLAVATAQLGVWEWNRARDEVYCTPDCLRIWGTREARISGEVFRQRLHPEDRARVLAEYQAAVETGQEFAREYRIVRPDQQVRWISDRGHIRYEADGTVASVVGTVQDITERKQADAGLHLQSAALEAAANAIVITDRAGTIEWVNSAFARQTGFTAAEAIGRNPRDLIRSDRHDASFYAGMWSTILAGEVWHGEIINRRRDGELYTEEMTITPVRDERGAIVRFIAIKQDITERKKLEAQLLRTQRLESVGRLASGIAHDLNNILSPMLLGPTMLRELVQHPGALEIVNAIEASAERGSAVIRQLLTFGRGLESQREPIQLRSLGRDMLKIMEETFPKNITPRLVMPKHLELVHGDETQIHQVLMNLCVNARDAMPRGGQLTVTLAAVDVDAETARAQVGVAPGRFIRLTVADTGTGIRSEDLDKIFDPFFTTKGVGEGTGLGLATTMGIVRSHKGFIQVNTEIGRGTEFHIFLPACGEGEASPRKPPPGPLPRGQHETILVVDDEESIRQVTRRMLEQQGYRVLDARNGADALEVLSKQSRQVDVVLTDLMMPVMDGPALIHALQAQYPHLKIITMSGYLAADQLLASLEAESLAFLAKPFSAPLLMTTLHRVLAA